MQPTLRTFHQSLQGCQITIMKNIENSHFVLWGTLLFFSTINIISVETDVSVVIIIIWTWYEEKIKWPQISILLADNDHQLLLITNTVYLVVFSRLITKLRDQENSLQFKRFLSSWGCPVHPKARQFYSFKNQTDFDHKWGQKEMIEFLSGEIFEITEWRLTGWLKYWHTGDYVLMIASVQHYLQTSRHQPPASSASSLFD